MDKNDPTYPRFVIVELFDDSPITAQDLAREIIGNLEDVKEAQPAYFDGFGRFVMTGRVERSSPEAAELYGRSSREAQC